MKKVALLVALAFVVTAGSASAWDILRKDFNYTPCLEMSVVGNVIHGQATLDGSPSFPAPITGYFHGGKAVFTISYLEGTGVRGYHINIPGLEGSTWGIYNDDASFYDPEHDAGLVACDPPEGILVGPSGAIE